MICVVASFPNEQNAKDGMIQRIASIDGLMAGVGRNYLDLSFRRFFRRNVHTQGLVTVYCLNVFVHAFLILRLLRSARIVYVHSAYNALRMFGFPTRAHIVFDAHGIVPEELELEGRKTAAKVLGLVERAILRRCDTLVCVTRSMLAHFRHKHGPQPARDEIVLPILPRTGDAATAEQALQSKRQRDTVIYAGGTQAWQNLEKMIDAASRQPQLSYTFLTAERSRFQALLETGAVRRFNCLTVPPAQVKDYYLTHQYGFVLREADLVNAVACPTKLVEYLYWGVLPIVITPCIGDFDAGSLRSVTLQQFLAGDLPDDDRADDMRRHNQGTVQALIASAQAEQHRLALLLAGTQQSSSTR